MENLTFSLNATMPIFLMMVLGYALHQIGWLDTDFASKLNKFVFLIPLPVNLFVQVSALDIREAWDTRFVVFCFVATLLSVMMAAVLSRLLHDHAERGEFVQAAYRSSASLIGVAFIENIYGTAGMAPLMIIGAVPLYNVMAVVALSLTDPENTGLDKKTLSKTARGIVTNPNVGIDNLANTLIELKSLKDIKLEPFYIDILFEKVDYCSNHYLDKDEILIPIEEDIINGIYTQDQITYISPNEIELVISMETEKAKSQNDNNKLRYYMLKCGSINIIDEAKEIWTKLFGDTNFNMLYDYYINLRKSNKITLDERVCMNIIQKYKQFILDLDFF